MSNVYIWPIVTICTPEENPHQKHIGEHRTWKVKYEKTVSAQWSRFRARNSSMKSSLLESNLDTIVKLKETEIVKVVNFRKGKTLHMIKMSMFVFLLKSF